MHKYTGRVSALALAVGVALGSNAQAAVVISQVYGGGGNSGATYKSDFIELHNNGSEAVDLSTWSVQYAATAGSSWQVTKLTGSIAPGGYYLVKQADGTGTAPALPTPDATGTIAMSGSAGKVALVASQTALTGSCPTGNVDFVGFGSATNCAETTPTANLGNAIAAIRADGGCTDSNNNAADFALATPTARNSASSLKACGPQTLPVLTIADASAPEGNEGTSFSGSLVASLDRPAGPGGVHFFAATRDGTAKAGEDYIAQNWEITIPEGQSAIIFVVPVYGDRQYEPSETFFIDIRDVTGATLADGTGQGTIVNDDMRVLSAIHDVQGAGARSPLVGQGVDVQGVVTGRKSNGFFLQAADADADADPMTSEGLFVFTSAAPPASAAVGNVVRVSGTVVEYVPSTDPNQLPLTELGSVSEVTLVSTGAALPTPVPLRTDFPSPTGGLDQLEPLEGMLVTVADATVVAPTQGNTNETQATGTSNGLFNVVVTGTPRPFREPGIQTPDLPPAGGTIPPIPVWDFNPELITVDSDALGGARLDVAFDTHLGNLTGPLDYGFRRYSILPLAQGNITVTPGAGSTPHPAAGSTDPDAFTVGGYNMERFFDTVNDPAVGEPVLTAAAFERRLSKASIGVRDYLRTPDILATVEMENLSTLQTLADRINNDAVAAGQPNPAYVPYLVEGNDVGGIDVGFLVKTADVGTAAPRVEVKSVTQVGKDVTWVEPNGSSSLLNDRPPLALDAVIHYADGRQFPVNVVAVHQRSLNGAETNDADGARIRLKRLHQAEFLAGYLNGRQRNEPNLHLVVLGDFNAFEFNDGLVDAMNVVTGTPTPDEQTAVPGDGVDYVNPDLINLGDLAPASERYSFVFGGNAQTLDHVLVNEELVLQTASIRMDHARINADFPETNRNDANSPSRLADHDPVLATFVPRHHADLAVTASAASPVHPGQPLVFNARLANNGPDSATAPGIGFAVDAVLPDLVATTSAPGWSCDAARVDAGRTSIACNATALANGQTVDFVLNAATTDAMSGRTFTLAAASDAQSLDDVPANNQASASVTVQAVADLGVRISGPGAMLRSGTVGHFPLLLSNVGPDAAPGARLVLRGDAPAANVRLNGATGWNCGVATTAEGFEATCLRASLARGTSQMIDVAVLAPPRVGKDTLTVSASLSSAAADPATGNNQASAVTRVIGSPR